METNEEPKKIFVGTHTGLHYYEQKNSDDIEYIRKDVFIEKACEFLESYCQETCDGTGYIAGIVNDKTIEDFRNYMKGE